VFAPWRATMSVPATAAEAVDAIRGGDARIATLTIADNDATLLAFSEGNVGSVASALGPDVLAFVFGAVLLDETKGGLELASESLARRKLVLLTWMGEAVLPKERGRVSELKSILRDKLPTLTAHVELQANAAAEAEFATILQKVKTASGGAHAHSIPSIVMPTACVVARSILRQRSAGSGPDRRGVRRRDGLGDRIRPDHQAQTAWWRPEARQEERSGDGAAGGGGMSCADRRPRQVALCDGLWVILVALVFGHQIENACAATSVTFYFK
jgi:hypothetical protein